MKYTLRELRARNRLTQLEVSEAVGLKSQALYSAIENLDESMAKKLADLFHVSVDEIEFVDRIN